MSKFMRLAIDKAWRYQLHTYPNPAVGACVVKDGEVLSVEAHHKAGSSHAEVNALKSAYLKTYPESILKNLDNSHDVHNFLKKNHNNFFNNCEIYVTLEPCNHMGCTPACAILLEVIKIKKIYIGTLDPNKKASGGKQRVEDAGIEVEISVCKKQTDELLYPFKKWQQDNFVFYKLAMREDGSVAGGYITTQDSLVKVHEIRTKLSLLVIGGQTVRVDRPMLNSRFAKQNVSPDILIYSNHKVFDKTIPLFNVENREVFIEDNLEKLNKNNFIMVEGGYNLFNSIKKYIDCLVLFISHKNSSNSKFDIEKLGFKKIYSFYINRDDEIVFLYKHI